VVDIVGPLISISGKEFFSVEFSETNNRSKCFLFVVVCFLAFVPMFYFLNVLTLNESYSTYQFIATCFPCWNKPIVYTIMSVAIDTFVVFDALGEFLIHVSIIYASIVSTHFWLQKVR